MNGATIKTWLLTLALFFTFFSKGYSIEVETQVGAREISIGYAALALISTFSLYQIQAALARINNDSLAIDYRQPFLIAGFASRAFAIIIPIPFHSLDLNF